MTDPYSGDPRLILGPGGSTIQFVAGQPVMDQGVENHGLLSLFADSNWVGNQLLPNGKQIGSQFEPQAMATALTAKSLSVLADLATKALTSTPFPSPSAVVTNPQSDRIKLVATVGPGKAPLSVQKFGPNWQAQATSPASARVTVTT